MNIMLGHAKQIVLSNLHNIHKLPNIFDLTYTQQNIVWRKNWWFYKVHFSTLMVDFSDSSTICTRCFETQSSPGCTCTRRSKILTHSLADYEQLLRVFFSCFQEQKTFFFKKRKNVIGQETFSIVSCSRHLTTGLIYNDFAQR